MNGEKYRLTGSFEGGVLDSGFHDVLGQLAAFAALGSDTQLLANFFKRTGTTIHKFLDLAVGNSFAEADVHGFRCFFA
jgi:hypothetical protein